MQNKVCYFRSSVSELGLHKNSERVPELYCESGHSVLFLNSADGEGLNTRDKQHDRTPHMTCRKQPVLKKFHKHHTHTHTIHSLTWPPRIRDICSDHNNAQDSGKAHNCEGERELSSGKRQKDTTGIFKARNYSPSQWRCLSSLVSLWDTHAGYIWIITGFTSLLM